MKLILPVAGKGARLRPHTFTKPKSLVRVAGKTVLQHVLDSFKDIEIEEFVVITDENRHIIEEYIGRHYPKLNVTYITQTELLGPAHAVWLASPRINEGDDVLVVFNDTLFVTDLTKIQELSEGLDGLIYSKEVDDPSRFGVNVMKDNLIVDMVEKPDEPISRLAQVGMYYLKDGRAFMDYINRTIEENRKVKGEFYLPEVFKLMIDDGFKLGAPVIEEWLDCGKPETLLQTNRFLLNQGAEAAGQLEGTVVVPPVFVHKSAVVRNSVIGPYVSVAEGCEISSSIIKDSVINPNSVLKNITLEDSLVGDAVELTGHLQRMNVGDNSIIDLSGRN